MSEIPSNCQDSTTPNQCQGVCSSHEFHDEHSKRMKHLDELQKQLTETKKKLTEASVRCHTLNLDVATMFSPESVEMLEKYKEECETCIARMSETLNESIDGLIPHEEKPESSPQGNGD